MKYRKKPVVVEAFQMTRERRQYNRDWPEWLNRAWNELWPTPGALSCENFPHSDGNDRLKIATLEGPLVVEWGDYIIQGVKGEIYPCKPDIFEATYEPAGEVVALQAENARLREAVEAAAELIGEGSDYDMSGDIARQLRAALSQETKDELPTSHS